MALAAVAGQMLAGLQHKQTLVGLPATETTVEAASGVLEVVAAEVVEPVRSVEIIQAQTVELAAMVGKTRSRVRLPITLEVAVVAVRQQALVERAVKEAVETEAQLETEVLEQQILVPVEVEPHQEAHHHITLAATAAQA